MKANGAGLMDPSGVFLTGTNMMGLVLGRIKMNLMSSSHPVGAERTVLQCSCS